MSVPGGGRRAPAQVAEATFEVFHVEMVRLIQLQHPPAALVAAGMDEPAARALQQARVNEKLEAIGTAAGARLVEKITKDLVRNHTFESKQNTSVFSQSSRVCCQNDMWSPKQSQQLKCAKYPYICMI